MRVLLAVLALWASVTVCAEDQGPDLAYYAQPEPEQLLQQGDKSGAQGSGTAAPAGNSDEARQKAARVLLELLNQNFSSNKVNYHFNSSGDSVCWATAGLAFIGSGSGIKSGPYQKSLKVVFDKLDKVMTAEDFKLQPVWGCAQAAVFLAELHRTAPPGEQPAIRTLLGKYVKKLETSQTSRGGWCHTFEDKKNELGYDDLMATTVMALQGLGMARREGLAVDQKVIDSGIKYIEASSQVNRGQIGYSPRDGQKGIPGPGRTAGGLLALMACGQGRSALAKAAGTYLTDSFVDRPTKTPQGALNTGHACAQMGQMWAAWWAAENKCYDKFWAGQGALIMGRRKENGEFRAAPSDGKAEESNGERGDFSNAMHALILVAEEGRLFAGAARNRTGPARVADAIDEAADVAEDWGAGAPACIQALAGLRSAPKAPSNGELSTRLTDVVKQLSKLPAEKSGPAILRLLGLSVEGKAEVKTVYMSPTRTLAVTVTASTVRVAGLVKADVQLMANEAFREGKAPAMPSLTPSVSNVSHSTTSILLTAGHEPPPSIQAQLEWDLAGLKFVQTIEVPCK